MGRYFRTATPQNIDFMYKLPENLMFKVAQQASEDISQNQAAVYDLYGKLQLPAIENDKEEAKALLGGYEAKINDISKTLVDNPLEFRRKSGDILGLAREMAKDFSTGKAANIASRYASLNEWEKRQFENKDIKDKEAITAMKANILATDKKAGGLKYNPVTQSGRSLPIEELYGTVDLNKQFMERANKIVAQVTANGNADKDGKYIYTWKNKTEKRTPEQIRQVLYSDFLADQDTQNYIKQRSKIGTMNGWLDKEGNFMSPTLEDVKDKSGKVVGQKEVWPEGSALKNLMDANVGRYQLFNTDYSRTMKSDAAYATDMALRMKTNIVDTKTGVQTVNPFGVDPSTTTPYDDVQKKITTLQQEGVTMFNQTQLNFENTILGLPNLNAEQKKILANSSREALAAAMQNGDFTKFKDVYAKAAKMGANIGTQDYKQAIEGIEVNLRAANTAKAQIATYEDIAKQKLGTYTPDQLKKKVNELMSSKANNQNMNTNTTSGDIFNDPIDKALYNDGLKQIGQEFANGSIPSWGVISEKKPDGTIVNIRVDGKDLKESKYYKDFYERNKQTPTTVATPYGSITNEPKETGNDIKKPLAQKVFQTIGYTNGTSTDELKDPYSIQLSDNVTFLIDKDTYSSSDMANIERKNKTSIDISTAIQDAILKSNSMKSVAKEVNAIPHYKPFELLGNGITFTPDGGVGVITVIDGGKSYTKPSDDEEIRRMVYEKLTK